MWRLPLPDVGDALGELVAAFTRSDGQVNYSLTAQEKAIILDVYGKYDEAKGQSTLGLLLPNLSDALQDAIFEAYAQVQKGKRLQALRDRLKIVADRCPLCGIVAVTDLDHYLPKSLCKVLSIYSRNLVPVCGVCNNKKRALEGPDCQLIHVYFADLPTERFLRATTSLQGSALKVEFTVERTPAMSEALFDSLTFHLVRLELSNRYEPEVNIFISSQEVSFNEAVNREFCAGGFKRVLRRPQIGA